MLNNAASRAFTYAIIATHAIGVGTVAPQTLPPAQVEARALLRNPDGYKQTRHNVPLIRVERLKPYEVSVSFRRWTDASRDMQLRRVLIFERYSYEKCHQDLCWRELARISSRDGPSQTVMIEPYTTEIIVAQWYVAPRRVAALHNARVNDCSTMLTFAYGSQASAVTACLESPYGEQTVTITASRITHPNTAPH